MCAKEPDLKGAYFRPAFVRVRPRRTAPMSKRVLAFAFRGLAFQVRDAYKVLDVSPRASLDAVKAAYRQRALALHPDVSGDAGSAERFAEVVQAFEAIVNGSAADEDAFSRRRDDRSTRGARVVGGILVVSIDELRRDPNYEVYCLRLALHGDGEVEGAPHSKDATATSAKGDVVDAMSNETVHVVRASQWDSVGDVRRLLQQQLVLPQSLRYEHGRHQEGGLELIAPGGCLLGEHLFLADYNLHDGDTLYFAVRRTSS